MLTGDKSLRDVGRLTYNDPLRGEGGDDENDEMGVGGSEGDEGDGGDLNRAGEERALTRWAGRSQKTGRETAVSDGQGITTGGAGGSLYGGRLGGENSLTLSSKGVAIMRQTGTAN